MYICRIHVLSVGITCISIVSPVHDSHIPFYLHTVDGLYTIPSVPDCLSLRPNWPHSPPLPLASVSPLELKGEGQTCLGGEGAEDWRVSLALCIFCACTLYTPSIRYYFSLYLHFLSFQFFPIMHDSSL
jgi:hypothetical protein